MLNLPLLSSHEPPLRVMSLHALAYCKRLFYLEEVEEIRVADERVFAGRQLHQELDSEDDGSHVQINLSSERLGLVGKVDCIQRQDGVYVPYEHKRGKPSVSSNKTPEAWPSDRLQVIAYALMIEEAYGQEVLEGRVRYHAANITVRVKIDDIARTDLQEAITAALILRGSVERPPITENENLCIKCSLSPVCLPEEVRQAKDKDHDIIRLFPPDNDGVNLHVLTQGSQIGVSGDSIVVRRKDSYESKHPIRNIETISIHGFNQITTQAIRKCVEHETQVHWLTTSGNHIASIYASAPQIQRRIRQYKALGDDQFCLSLARRLVLCKVESQYRYLLRTSRGEDQLRVIISKQLNGIQMLLPKILSAESKDVLLGFEGASAAFYFSGLRMLVSPEIDDRLKSESRSRRPPKDPFNALLSFGYGLLYSSALSALHASGLEPAFGFYHTPRSAAYPLVLDLMEIFRVLLWDMPLIGSLNRNQWNIDKDFVITKAKVWLSEPGRKKAIELFENRVQESWKHPVLDYSISYARTMELESRLLEKEWSGEPGLFARSRIR